MRGLAREREEGKSRPERGADPRQRTRRTGLQHGQSSLRSPGDHRRVASGPHAPAVRFRHECVARTRTASPGPAAATVAGVKRRPVLTLPGPPRRPRRPPRWWPPSSSSSATPRRRRAAVEPRGGRLAARRPARGGRAGTPTRRRGERGRRPRPRRGAGRRVARGGHRARARGVRRPPRGRVDDAGQGLPPRRRRYGDFRAMPALGGGFAMLKWISSFPGNPSGHGLPTVMGVVCLSDAATSAPRLLLDARAVTALRTGAVAAVAAQALAAPGRVDGGDRRLRPARRVGGALPGRRGLRARASAPTRGPRRRTRWPPSWAGRPARARRRWPCDVVCCVTPGHEPVVGRRGPAPGPAPEHARRRRAGQGRGDASRRSPPARCSATSGSRRRTAAS